MARGKKKNGSFGCGSGRMRPTFQSDARVAPAGGNRSGCLTTEVRQSLFLCKNQIIQAAFFLQRI